MRVYFITSEFNSDRFRAAPDDGGQLVTTCLNCKTPIVMTPSLTGTAWTTKEGAGA